MKEKRPSCLVVTYGPVPTPEYQTVEGGGMRAWGLAKGLAVNGVDVVVAVNDSFPQKIGEHEGIRLVNWSLDNNFSELLNSYDSVIASYCMGDPSVFIAKNLNDDVQLILDVYVPIYIEVSARESKDIETEYTNYMADIVRFNHVLKRGDYFLCANDAQKTFYVGVLAALGIVNPRSYRDERILVVPFGIHDTPAVSKVNPYKEFGIADSDFTVLWFGGLYPWFRIEELLGALLTLSKNPSFKFVFVGGKNPFNPNPDFSAQYEKAVEFAKKHNLTNKSVFFQDWVDFEDRINWYKHADVVISINQPGNENQYSWRTRVMDYVWGELAILTNGGDPLSEDLIKAKAAIKLDQLDSKAISESLSSLQNETKMIQAVRKSITDIKPTYYWDRVVLPIVEVLFKKSLPYDSENKYRQNLHLPSTSSDVIKSDLQNSGESKIKKILRAGPKVISYAKRKGFKQSVKIASSIAKTQVKKRTTNRARQFVFIGHPVDNTGAPLVLMEIIEEFARKYGGKRVKVISPLILPNNMRRLQELGVTTEKAAHALNFRLIRLQLGLRRNDFVLMNTVAIYPNYREFILLWLKLGRLKHANWFIHEDKDQLKVVCREFLEAQTLTKLQKLVSNNQLSIFVPSKRTKIDYDKILNTNKVKAIPLKVDVKDKYKKPRPASEYSSVNFLISGTPSDGRKGQLLALAAFYNYYTQYYLKSPKEYRPFSLHLIAIGDDYVSQQIRWISDSLLPKMVNIHPQVTNDEAQEITAHCNAVICCSLNETFAIYVAEGMHMGHIVLRNNTAGMEEQLVDGGNGYFIDHTDITQFAKQIERLLNKKMTNERLQKMGALSQEMVTRYINNSYLDELGPVDSEK